MNALDKDGFEISRRKMLSGLDTVGIASAGRGRDEYQCVLQRYQQFENNQLTGGTSTCGNFDTGNSKGDLLLSDESSLWNLDPTNFQTCFGADASTVSGLTWGFSVDHASGIQVDSVAFDLGFYTE